MRVMGLLPLLTEKDPGVSVEGALDPLGLYPIADVLALALIPGIRERQSHPRFLTAIAVGLSLCADMEDEIAADGASEPWQVFEWYLVEGLVRTTKDSELLRGLPGRDKASHALQNRAPLSRSSYLKAPNVFGFHGVYRSLSRDLGVESGGRLGELGYELVSIWSKEQNLNGFIGTGGGEGAKSRRAIRDAIRDGLSKGATHRSGAWSGWDFFGAHLGHHDIGRNETKLIQQALRRDPKGHRGEVLDYLCSPEGRMLWSTSIEATDYDESEERFHGALLRTASSDLAELLRAIQAYETFSRLLQDAFDDCLRAMTKSQGKTPLCEFAALDGVRKACREVPRLFDELVDQLTPFGVSLRFQEVFVDIAGRAKPIEWASNLLEHHHHHQRRKPPQGKLPLFERFDDGDCIVRPAYRREAGGRHDTAYVQNYRTRSLWSFAVDLGMVR